MSATIISITGLQNLANLQEFRADYNSLTSINFSTLTNLTYIDISDNNIPGGSTNSLTSVNLTGCTALQELRFDDSNFSAGIPNLSGLTNLQWIDFDQCGITGSVNISFLPNLNGCDFSGNLGLTELIISNTQPIGSARVINVSNCALTQQAVDNILSALDANGLSDGTVYLDGGTNSYPSVSGMSHKTNLESKNWYVGINPPPTTTSTTTTTTTAALGLRLTFDSIANANAIVGDSSDVNDWNTLFDLPTYGNPFTSVEVVGNEIRLLGGSDIVVREYLFVSNPLDPFTSQNVGLVSIDDSIGCIIEVQEGAFYCSYRNIIDGFTSDAIGKNGVGGNYLLEPTGGTGLYAQFNVNVSGGLVVDYIQLSYGGLDYQIGDTLTILGSQFGGVDGVDDITITVTSIYNTAQTLTSVNLPACTLISTTTNSYGAFGNCRELTTVNIPLLEEAYGYSFAGCILLTSVNFPLLTITGNGIFASCTSLTTVNLPLLTIGGDDLFAGCTLLQTIDLPNLTTAGDYCFSSCTSLTTIDLPNLTTAGIYCFNECYSLQTVNLPNLTTAGDYCFIRCESLVTIDLPSLTSAGTGCFYICISLQTIDLPSCTNLGGTVFSNIVFDNIIGNTITLTVPSALMTCNAGNPDGDISYLQANNTVTVITI